MSDNNLTRTHDTQEEINAFLGFLISESFMAMVMCFILPLELWGFYEFYHSDEQKSKVVMRMRISLILNNVFAIFLIAFAIADASIVGMSQPVCDFFARMIAFIYLIGLIFAYLFLLQKVRLVSRFERDPLYIKMFWCTELALAAMMPMCIILYAIVTTGKLTPEGRCMQIDPQWTYWFFSVGNAFLSSMLIYLFSKPLWKMISLDNGTPDEYFRVLYRRNVFISSFAVLVTFSAVLGYGVLHYFAELHDRDDYNVIGMTLVGWDSFTLAICCRLTTVIWLPKSMQRCLGLDHRPTSEEHARAVVVVDSSRPLVVAPAAF